MFLIIFENIDPNTERFLLIQSNVHGALSAKKQTCNEQRKQIKQTNVGVFLKGNTTSGRTLGKSFSIGTIRVDHSMCVIP
jgi:hypothetical protein